MMKGRIRGLLAVSFLLGTSGLFAEDEQRDYYAEPGLNPFASGAGQDVTETIDPFSGNVNLRYVDLKVPGNGGLDITIQRSYNLPQGLPSYANPYGFGWSMHFGRITIPSANSTELCGVPGTSWGVGVSSDNPSIEFPDGGREVLVQASQYNGTTGIITYPVGAVYITKSNWTATCIDPGNHEAGVKVTAPNGTKYFMDVRVYMEGEAPSVGEDPPYVETWFTSRIEDLDGNWIDITYQEISNGLKVPVQIDASDNRQVELEYRDQFGVDINSNSDSAHLHKITANDQTWTYEYDLIDGDSADNWGVVPHYKLKKVIRPDSSTWEYFYGGATDLVEQDRLLKVKYPFGGEVSYEYDWLLPLQGHANSQLASYRLVAIDKKTQVNPGGAAGVWDYTFTPGGTTIGQVGITWGSETQNRLIDVTEISTPVGLEKIYHIGYQSMNQLIFYSGQNWYSSPWTMGLKLAHDYYEKDGSGQATTRVRRFIPDYYSRQISAESDPGGMIPNRGALRTYVAFPSKTTEILYSPDGTIIHSYTTTNSSPDFFGNPQVVTETRLLTTLNGDKKTQFTYYNDTAKWVIGLPLTERVFETEYHNGAVTIPETQVNHITRDYYSSNGRLKFETHNGVRTDYTYTPQGDTETITDAKQKTTTYSFYHRGVAQKETFHDATFLDRSVNNTGTVASETTQRGYTTSFFYDDLNRLTSINYPIGYGVTINWNQNSKTLTRGNYQETVIWDGFGHDKSVTRMNGGESFVRTFDYDALGRKIFESDTNGGTTGIQYQYDVLGRMTRVINQDGTDREIVYDGGWREVHTDEVGNVTQHLFQIWGSPANKHLFFTISPEDVGTRHQVDATGRLKTVMQGKENPEVPGEYIGWQQTYGYNANKFLVTIGSPHDIGTTTYGRDAVGNMISKQVAESETTVFEYDDLHRLAFILYDDPDTPDVSHTYYDDGLIETISTAGAGSTPPSQRTYEYDDNGNLDLEIIDIGANSYQIDYVIDLLDNLEGIYYPSGRYVDYAPDALGRPTQAAPYVSNIVYFPDGNINEIHYGNGLKTTYTRTPRHWIDKITVDNNLLSLDYDYDDVGNVEDITDFLNSSNTRSMLYDGLNRLTSQTRASVISTYEYTAQNDFKQKSDPTASNRDLIYHYDPAHAMLPYWVLYDDNLNVRYFNYDEYGNIILSTDYIADGLTNPPTPQVTLTQRHYSFNEAQNLTFSLRTQRNQSGAQVPLGTGSFTAEYDGKNNRIKKINHDQGDYVTEYLYSDAGLLLGEYDESGINYGLEYFYLGSQQIATHKRNAPPVPKAGADVQVVAGVLALLDASASTDTDGAITQYAWRQVNGPEVTLNNASSKVASFITPAGLAPNQQLEFELTVTDDRGMTSTADRVIVTILANSYPTANAGPDVYALTGDNIVLDGTQSSDPEGAITYFWEITPSSAITDVGGLYTATPVLKVKDLSSGVNTLNITGKLTVTDAAGLTRQDTMLLRVYRNTYDVDGDGMPTGWELKYAANETLLIPGADDDSDGFTNIQEYQQRTNPKLAELPQAVTGLVLIPRDGSVALNWDAAVGAQSYTLLWSNSPDMNAQTANRVTNVTSGYVHTGLANGAAHYYRIAAINSAGEGPVSSIRMSTPSTPNWFAQSNILASQFNTTGAQLDLGSNIQITGRGEVGFISASSDGGLTRNYINTQWGDVWSRVNSPRRVGPDGSNNLSMADNGMAMVSVGWLSGVYQYRSVFGPRVPNAIWYLESETDTGSLTQPAILASYSPCTACRQASVAVNSSGAAISVMSKNNGVVHAARRLPGRSPPWTDELTGVELGSSGVGTSQTDTQRNYRAVIAEAGHGGAVWLRPITKGSQNTLVRGLGVDGTNETRYSAITLSSAGINATMPGVGVDSAGIVTAAWLENGDTRYAQYNPVSNTWGASTVAPRTTGTPVVTHTAFSVNSAGTILLIQTEKGGRKARFLPKGGNWSQPVTLGGGGVDTKVQLSDDGTAVVAWTDAGAVMAARYNGSSWGAPMVASSGTLDSLDGNLHGQVALLFKGSTDWGIATFRSQQPPNTAPVANAGSDMLVPELSRIYLDGSASSDSESGIISYHWEQLYSPNKAGILHDADTARPYFDSPKKLTGTTEVFFQLTVTDARGVSVPDIVRVTVYPYSDDTDSDLLPDGWEFAHFGGLQEAGGDDGDGDGGTNKQEYDLNTNPKVKNDKDLDTVGDWLDNCPEVQNADQGDSDNDAIGDACDTPAGCA